MVGWVGREFVLGVEVGLMKFDFEMGFFELEEMIVLSDKLII